ncbi:Tetratricopeptide-like helical domain,HAT (Half-A-TPR) repeat [Cinara cedri]|uniref:Tetratricopeptide-like helical domain,HAT (Half-A-TPR) repeat n=1 Tax=Cinara cedri TaxID=506608 RepID=A0A5E4MQ33_9HEMI|nr:Tetratricopeptide-like helical domain,HAT (Half-A-TPR) repeat [Cinara cedri]
MDGEKEPMSRNVNSKEKIKNNDSIPELDSEPPKLIINNPPFMYSNKLQKPSDLQDDLNDCLINLPNPGIINITDVNEDEFNKVVFGNEIQGTSKGELKEPEIKVTSKDEFMVIDTESAFEDELMLITSDDEIEIVSDEELSTKNRPKKLKLKKINNERKDENKTQTNFEAEKVQSITEFDKLWQVVRDDSSNFSGWTNLLKYIDQENKIVKARVAYTQFLDLYPCCYDYWIKFAEFEKRNNNLNKVEVIFQRGLRTLQLSVDLWFNYMTFLMAYRSDNIHYIRGKFEECLTKCGLVYYSDRLWDIYIKWEINQNELKNVFDIYNRLLVTQTFGYLIHFEHFKEFVNKNEPYTFLNAKEYFELRQQIAEELKIDESNEFLPDDSMAQGKNGNTFSSEVSEKELLLIKEAIIESKYKIHQKTAKEIEKRQVFEEGIKRPYFNIKPLELSQIENWKRYIEFEKETKNHNRIVIIYERCLIPCALYEDFWLSYVEYLELSPYDVCDLLHNLFTRACVVHHRKSPKLHFKWAEFEEFKGNVNKAAEILKHIDEVVPHTLHIVNRRINLEKRRNNYGRTCELFEHYMDIYQQDMFSKSIIAIKYARFLWKNANEIEKAIQVITEIINEDKKNMYCNERLLLQLIELKINLKPLNVNSVIQMFDEIMVMDNISLKQKALFSQHKLEFLEEYTCDYKSLDNTTDEFLTYSSLSKTQEMAESWDSALASYNHQYYITGYYHQQYMAAYNQYINAGLVDPNEFYPNEVDPNEVDPNEVDPNEVNPNEVDPNEVNPNEFDPDEFDSQED